MLGWRIVIQVYAKWSREIVIWLANSAALYRRFIHRRDIRANPRRATHGAQFFGDRTLGESSRKRFHCE